MKNMEVLIDTNIILDWLLKRKPFAEQIEKVIEHCTNGKIKSYLACHTLTNIFYILRKEYSLSERKDIVLLLCDSFSVIEINRDMILDSVTHANFKDLEDSLQTECAVRYKLNYIITRNIKDFNTHKVKAISPEEFLNIVNESN